MKKILVSACLLGEQVRYDKKTITYQHQLLSQWQAQNRLVAFCPEVAGGLPVPRDASEIITMNPFVVVTNKHNDVTQYFEKGAQLALDLCREQQINVAILTEKSPSCGSSTVYDGNFSNTLKPGEGLTTHYLRQHGISVFNQHQLELVKDLIS